MHFAHQSSVQDLTTLVFKIRTSRQFRFVLPPLLNIQITSTISPLPTMARLQFTPWKESSQLLLVRNQFYPGSSYDSPEMRAKACSLVSILSSTQVPLLMTLLDQVWAWRTRGNLPHAVESTALLTEAILHDDASEKSLFSIRATYCAAFCRCV